MLVCLFSIKSNTHSIHDVLIINDVNEVVCIFFLNRYRGKQKEKKVPVKILHVDNDVISHYDCIYAVDQSE